MKQFKARCSALSQIMSSPKTKSKTDEVKLSLTCTKFVENWIKETHYGRSFQIDTMPIRKGNETEIEATALVSAFLKEKLTRDNELMFNDYLTGHADINWKKKRIGIDTKVCKDFSTFPILEKEIQLDHYWQGQGYMDLTEYDEWWFAKCAINTPLHELERMEKATWFRLMDIYGDESSEYFQADHEEFLKNLFMAHVIDNSISIKGKRLDDFGIAEIPKENRVKIIKVQRNQADIDLIKPRVEEIRAFLKQNNF